MNPVTEADFCRARLTELLPASLAAFFLWARRCFFFSFRPFRFANGGVGGSSLSLNDGVGDDMIVGMSGDYHGDVGSLIREAGSDAGRRPVGSQRYEGDVDM